MPPLPLLTAAAARQMLMLLLLLLAPAASATSASSYHKVLDPTLSSGHLEDLPGFTRSVVARDHALITPESRVFSPLPGWTNTLSAHLVTPAMGAHFAMSLLMLSGNATSAPSGDGVERFVFVLTGSLTFVEYAEADAAAAASSGNQCSTPGSSACSGELKREEQLEPDSFVYLPPHTTHSLQSETAATIVLIERRYCPLAATVAACQPGTPRQPVTWPSVVVGRTSDQPVMPVQGEVFILRKLLPTTSEYDFNIHVMDFMPGEYLNVKEVHYNQHGLLLLEGRGIYRLADSWYPVQAGDAIWMAPFVPQWYAALGKSRSRYLLYKDTNRDPLLHPSC